MEMIQEGCYHKLVIHQVALEDEGTYSIEVGEHTSTAKLMVEGEYPVNSTSDFIYISIYIYIYIYLYLNDFCVLIE